MRRKLSMLVSAIVLVGLTATSGDCIAAERTISHQELLDKIRGFWIGQLVGNYMGFPFENIYVEAPIPFLVDRYYTFRDDPLIRVNRDDLRGYVPIVAHWLEGAFSDDDTDIEFVTLHAVERFGLDINYQEITSMWKQHINRKIWVATRTARDLMEDGLVAPATGSKENNHYWYQIDSQLENEIWGAFYPGMVTKAGERSLWGARITNDDWGTHPTIAYGVMYSAAFFEKDVEKLVELAIEAVPNQGPFIEGMRDVVRWRKLYPDWRQTRKRVHEKYYAYRTEDYEAPVSVVSSLQNGLCGVLAILYGEGSFRKTVGIAVSAGYDCDNQAATCAGLMGVLNGEDCIPDEFTRGFLPQGAKWKKPFNDRYLNYSRDGLPIATEISDIAERIAAIAGQAIVDNGGRKEIRNGKVVYTVNCDF